MTPQPKTASLFPHDGIHHLLGLAQQALILPRSPFAIGQTATQVDGLRVSGPEVTQEGSEARMEKW
jgi:hypothetical protein